MEPSLPYGELGSSCLGENAMSFQQALLEVCMAGKNEWSGAAPEKCGMCYHPFVEADRFYDGATIFGPWAILCSYCFSIYGVKRGKHKGKRYRIADTERSNT